MSRTSAPDQTPRGLNVVLLGVFVVFAVSFGLVAALLFGPFIREIWLSQTARAVALTVVRSDVYTREVQGKTTYTSCQARSFFGGDERHWLETRLHSEPCLAQEPLPPELASGQVIVVQVSAMTGGYIRAGTQANLVLILSLFAFILLLIVVDRLLRWRGNRARRQRL